MDIDSLAQALFGSPRAETQEVATDGTTRTYMGVAMSDSDGGTVVVDLGGDVTLPDDLYDEDGNVVAEYASEGIEVSTGPSVQEGDEVTVTLVGGGALKTPMVTSVSGEGDRQNAAIAAAQTVANAAQAVAEAVNQHFFADTSGIHVTEATQEDWDESHTGANVLINSIGQLFRDGLNNLLTLTTENGARALTIWDGLGNAASNVLATFGATETHIGMSGTGNVYMANDKFLLSAETSEGEYEEGMTYTQVESGFKAQNLGENYHVYSGLNSKLNYNDDGGYTASDTYIDAWVEDSTGHELHRAYVELWADPLYQTAVRLHGDEIGLGGNSVWYQSPYNGYPLDLGKPVVRSASKSMTITSTNTWIDGPSVYLDQGQWLVVGVACFNTGSSSGSRKLRAQLRLGSSVYAEGTEVRVASNEYGRVQATAIMTVNSADGLDATLVLSSSMNFTSATTSYVTAVQLA